MIIEDRGRPDLEDVETIKERLIQLIEALKVAHPERVRKAYNQQYRNQAKLKISWATIRKYIDELKNEGKIREEVLTKGKRRTISFIRTNF